MKKLMLILDAIWITSLFIFFSMQCMNATHPEELEDTIKSFMKLSITCKQLNTLLTYQTISDYCQYYSQHDKDQMLLSILNTIETFATAYKRHEHENNSDEYQKLLTIMHETNNAYNTKRLPMLILLCADADANMKNASHSLIELATRHHDIALLKILFQHNADPNTESIEFENPVFFHAQTIEIAKLFIDNKVDLQVAAKNNYQPNVLWAIISDNYPADLLVLYLDHHVDPNKQLARDNSCLLHKLASDIYITSTDELLKKAALLCNVIPNMINTITKKGHTPLNNAQESLKLAYKYDIMPEAFEELITFFKTRGCLTIQELVEKDESFGCFICMQAEENDILNLSCINPHNATICPDCYEQLLINGNVCPLCRNPLTFGQSNNQ